MPEYRITLSVDVMVPESRRPRAVATELVEREIGSLFYGLEIVNREKISDKSPLVLTRRKR